MRFKKRSSLVTAMAALSCAAICLSVGLTETVAEQPAITSTESETQSFTLGFTSSVVAGASGASYTEETNASFLDFNGLTLSGDEYGFNWVTYSGTAKDGEGNDVALSFCVINNGGRVQFTFTSDATEYVLDADSVYTKLSDKEGPETISFDADYILSYEGNVPSWKAVSEEDPGTDPEEKTSSVLSIDGKGNWATVMTPAEGSPWTDMISYVNCSMTGLWTAGGYYDGTAYLADDTTQIQIMIWIADATQMPDVNMTTYKLAVYIALGEEDAKAVKIHKGDIFKVQTANDNYADEIAFDDDYLLKWEPATSRVTAGRYNNDMTGPVIRFDQLQLIDANGNAVTFNEGDEPPALIVSASDDVDDSVEVTETWSEGALDADGKLCAGTHTLTFSAVDQAGNEAEEVTATIIVIAKAPVTPDDSSDADSEATSDKNGSENVSGGCGSVVAGSGIALASLLLGAVMLKKKK